MSPSSSECQSQPRDSFAWLTRVVVQFPLNQHTLLMRDPGKIFERFSRFFQFCSLPRSSRIPEPPGPRIDVTILGPPPPTHPRGSPE
jgi:hypothetical protein